MFDPVKPIENFVESKISDVRLWVINEEARLKLEVQILAFSKMAEVLTAEVEKLKAALSKLPA